MTISSSARTAGPFAGPLASSATLPFAFKIFQKSDLLVVRTSALLTTRLVLSSDYSVTMNGDQNVAPGGFVTLLVSVASGSTVVVTSDIAATQEARLTNAGGFFPQIIEDALDRLTILHQQNRGRNTLRVPVGEELNELPGAPDRALKLQGYDSAGQPLMLVGIEPDSATALDLELRSAYTAGQGAGQVAFDSDLPYAPGTAGFALKRLDERVTFEDFGAIGNDVADDFLALQAGLDWARDNSRSIFGDRKYKSSGTLTMRQDRLSPPVNQDFASVRIRINQLRYTGTGKAISDASPVAGFDISRLIGPGTGTGTEGLYVTGQGDGARHRIDWVGGFDRGISFDEAYSHTIEVGYVHDCLRGIRINGNAIRVFGGRVGGQFSTASIDPTSCNVGVEVTAGSVANEIYANIEYCRRTTSSIGLLDMGIGTIYQGYLESNNLYSLQALGNDGRYTVLNGGNNNVNPSGYQITGLNNRMRLMSQQGAIEETPSGSVNTLQYLTLQPFESVGTSTISSDDGHEEFVQGTGQYRNELAYSSDLSNVAWAQSVIGAALWADVTITTGSNGYAWGGLLPSTRFVFPARAGDGDIWRIGQSSLTTIAGILNFGLVAKVASGDVEIMIRLAEPTNVKQTRTLGWLRPSNKFVKIGREYLKQATNASDAVFEISFRSRTGGTIDLCGAFLVNQPRVLVPPTNLASFKRPLLPGRQVDGSMFPAGVIVNGPLQTQASPLVAAGTTIDTIEYPVYIVTGGWTGSILLNAPAAENARVVFKRDGVAATGTINLTPSGTTIDGLTTSFVLTSAWTKIELLYSSAINSGAGGWLNVT